MRMRPEEGYVESSTKVAVYREFDNIKANGLGIALPRGRVRFYRRSGKDAIEFTGENNIDHTPQDEKVRAYTGDAFDLVAERKRTDFQSDQTGRAVTESFEIRLRNHKDEKVEIRVVEHLYRWTNWKLIDSSLPSKKIDSRTVEFLVAVEPGAEQILTYKVQYNW